MERLKIYQLASKIVEQCGTRDPIRIADDIGIIVLEKDFEDLLGMYSYIYRNRFIFLNANLPDVLIKEVMAHEIGHDQLHRHLAKAGMQEFRLYHMRDNTEYEANVFAAHILMDNDEVYDLFRSGYDITQVAAMQDVDINLALIKAEEMRYLGYDLNPVSMKADGRFLRDIKIKDF